MGRTAWRRFTAASVTGLLVVALLVGGCSRSAADRDTLYQVSTLQALMEGVYDGETTIAELRRHGDLGLGTFNALDGEMIMLDGVCYQVAADGVARVMPSSTKTPFAVVTPFGNPETEISIIGPISFETLKQRIDGTLNIGNMPCAFRIEGRFSYVKTRSVPRQEKPYPRLSEVVKNHQPTFEFHDVEGVLVGFRLPEYLGGINATGYHLHFLNAERTGGGHLLDFTADALHVAVDESPRLCLVLPRSGAFHEAFLDETDASEIDLVEKGGEMK